jgi:hypothetical protein
MSHLDICSTSYGQKKGRESNLQFGYWPLKVGNWPDPGVCRWSVTHCWKVLDRSYKFASDLIPIGGRNWELWASKVPRVQIGIVSRFLLGSPRTKSHSDVVPWANAKNTIWGNVVVSPESRPWWIKWIHIARGLSQHPECFWIWTNQLVGWFWCRTE